MTKIVSFGDSFVFGSELAHNEDGSQSWIAQASRNLGATYKTCAKPGCGNDYIARQIYSYFGANSADATLAVINWTWISRWDFYIAEHKTWITLGPTCVPETLKDLISQTEANDLIEFYRDRANSSLLWNKFRNLQTIWAVQSYLERQGVQSIQTYMDYDMFDMDCYHEALTPDYINELQNLVYPKLELFEGRNFVDWSHDRGYAVTNMGRHPLEDAHRAACDLWQDRYAQALNR